MNLDSGFEADLREAVLDNAEQQLIGRVEDATAHAHDTLRAYGEEFDYDVDPIIASFEGPIVDRSNDRLTIRWGWTHDASVYMEFGTSDHTVEGDPVLSFIWEDAPTGVHETFPGTERVEGDPRVFLPEVEVAGLEETRFVRDALNWLRREVQQ